MPQTTVNILPNRMMPGLYYGDFYNEKTRTAMNSAVATAPVSTLTVGAIVASTDYFVTLFGTTIKINSAALSAAAFATRIVDVIRQTGNIYNKVSMTVASNVITFTGRIDSFYRAIDLTTSSGLLAVAVVTTAANPTVLPFGRFVAVKPGTAPSYVPNARSFTQNMSLINATTDVIKGVSATNYAYEKIFDVATNQWVGGIPINQPFDCFSKDDIPVECDSPIVFTGGVAPTVYVRFAPVGSFTKTGVLTTVLDAGSRAFTATEGVTVLQPSVNYDGIQMALVSLNINN